ncbi:hypothetical protein [Neptuniibacter sp. QD37_11]|uniref:hypothetical protein n=1 Tax=Neptuniibacter sp. QD37_11 TaxID=3398209 RepID=UPI0039F62557
MKPHDKFTSLLSKVEEHLNKLDSLIQSLPEDKRSDLEGKHLQMLNRYNKLKSIASCAVTFNLMSLRELAVVSHEVLSLGKMAKEALKIAMSMQNLNIC